MNHKILRHSLPWIKNRGNPRVEGIILNTEILFLRGDKMARSYEGKVMPMAAQVIDSIISYCNEPQPIQVAEYAIDQGIKYKLAINYWVCHVLKKRDRITSSVKWCSTWYLKRTHKFGIELPKMIKKAIAISKNNRNTLREDTIAKK